MKSKGQELLTEFLTGDPLCRNVASGLLLSLGSESNTYYALCTEQMVHQALLVAACQITDGLEKLAWFWQTI